MEAEPNQEAVTRRNQEAIHWVVTNESNQRHNSIMFLVVVHNKKVNLDKI